jgi:hypothetical protein
MWYEEITCDALAAFFFSSLCRKKFNETLLDGVADHTQTLFYFIREQW